jgi:hypothetical protein
MTEQDQNLTTADIANRETKAEKDAEDTERPLQRDPEAREESPEAVGARDELEPLLAPDDTEGFRSRWESIQTGFVDEPRQAVEQADSLVAELMQRLAESFTEERESLESQWSRGDDVSTEDLRVGLQRYRSFFERLLST